MIRTARQECEGQERGIGLEDPLRDFGVFYRSRDGLRSIGESFYLPEVPEPRERAEAQWPYPSAFH
jgi:hypothetical protein